MSYTTGDWLVILYVLYLVLCLISTNLKKLRYLFSQSFDRNVCPMLKYFNLSVIIVW